MKKSNKKNGGLVCVGIMTEKQPLDYKMALSMTHEDNICNGRGGLSEEMAINERWQVITVTCNKFFRGVLI